ncbi:MAG: bacillithiol biosynthesis BshC, partial [Planctomycetota bacterium]
MAAVVRAERLEPGRGPAEGPFARALRGEAGPARGFLPSLPSSEDAWKAALDEAASRLVGEDARRSAIAKRLAERQAALGAGERAVAGARALGRPSTLAVVTGHQPGLLGGPLLTFHKAAGAVHLARQLDGLGGHRVVPVFWLASEDHDLDEANRLGLLDREGQVRRLRLDLDADGRSMMHREVPAEAVGALMASVAETLPATDRAPAALALVGRPPGEAFGSWCARAFLALLGEPGLVLVEPDVLLPFAGPEFGMLVRRGTAIRDAMAACGRRLRARDLPAPLAPPVGELPLFLRMEARGRRRRLHEQGNGTVRIRDAPGSMTLAELAARLEAHPDLGSGDAAGRVFVQNALLPVAVYLGGPTELAYHAQVRAAHEAVGRAYPRVVPRPSATWIDKKAE